MANVKKLQFRVEIRAPVERVWQVMLGPESYREWTRVFAEGSTYEGSWDPGATIRFLGPSGDGMVAMIAESRLHEFISIKHLGFVVRGVDDLDSEQVRAWAPAYENYTFRAIPGGTELVIDQDVTEAFEAYLLETWPKALARLGELAEGQG